MTKIVDLQGKPLNDTSTLYSPDAALALKALVTKLEAGEIKGITKWIFLYAVTDEENHPGLCDRRSLDSELTAAEALMEIELHKDTIMSAYR
jgi:hypothetical protein